MAPRLTGRNLQGEYVALEDHLGKVVLLNIWATWCGPCRQELPELRALQREHGGEAFTVLGVSIDSERDEKKVQRMAEQFQLGYPILLDPAGKSLDAFGVIGYPTSFVLGADGTILWRRNGIIHPRDGELEGQIRAALSARG